MSAACRWRLWQGQARWWRSSTPALHGWHRRCEISRRPSPPPSCWTHQSCPHRSAPPGAAARRAGGCAAGRVRWAAACDAQQDTPPVELQEVLAFLLLRPCEPVRWASPRPLVLLKVYGWGAEPAGHMVCPQTRGRGLLAAVGLGAHCAAQEEAAAHAGPRPAQTAQAAQRWKVCSNGWVGVLSGRVGRPQVGDGGQIMEEV